ncbi:GNAT family N-acetyltransferase [Plantactinospora soyae]|uniref:GNAT superfamily N-acetyltransferase n=1 Tax=Plantactinospora soyae TaxID=1544732 RepID=A0A927QV66_9ACTN|nr:GNAT family N-acetyltransferase [Plantactinospora soyae]MBE1485370.1 GNAT superfamily N-acetyltransferase [Plantactinospora soyae]
MANTITIHALSSMPAEHIRPWRTVLAASLAHDLLGQPLPTLEQVHTPGTTTGLDSRRLFWRAAEPDGTVNGVAALRLFTPQGQETLAEMELHVHLDRRRRDVGSRLLAQAVLAARVENRRSLIISVADIGPGIAFCAVRDFQRVLTLRHLLIGSSEVDETGAATDRPHPRRRDGHRPARPQRRGPVARPARVTRRRPDPGLHGERDRNRTGPPTSRRRRHHHAVDLVERPPTTSRPKARS